MNPSFAIVVAWACGVLGGASFVWLVGTVSGTGGWTASRRARRAWQFTIVLWVCAMLAALVDRILQ